MSTGISNSCACGDVNAEKVYRKYEESQNKEKVTTWGLRNTGQKTRISHQKSSGRQRESFREREYDGDVLREEEVAAEESEANGKQQIPPIAARKEAMCHGCRCTSKTEQGRPK